MVFIVIQKKKKDIEDCTCKQHKIELKVFWRITDLT